MALYTPFFERNTAKLVEQKKRFDVGQAAQSAYMSGDMGNLYAQDPNVAAQMERTQMQRQQIEQQGQAQQQRNQQFQAQQQRQIAADEAKQQERVSALQKELAPKAAEFDNFEEFNAFMDSQALARGVEGVDAIDQANFDLLKQAYPDEKSSQRNDKIAALAQMYGDAVPNPLEVATKMVDGLIDINFSDDGKEIVMVDKTLLATNPAEAVTRLPVANLNPDVERPQPEPGQSLWELAPLVAGAGSAARAGISALTGQIGLPVAEETIEARQTFGTEKNSLIRALSINPRFPVAEITRIEREINIAPQILDSERGLKARMRSIDRSLRNRIAQESRDAGDSNLSDDSREDARKAAADMQNFLDVMGVPGRFDIEDIDMEYIQEINSDDARSVIREMTQEEYNSLPIGVINALREKAGG